MPILSISTLRGGGKSRHFRSSDIFITPDNTPKDTGSMTEILPRYGNICAEVVLVQQIGVSLYADDIYKHLITVLVLAHRWR